MSTNEGNKYRTTSFRDSGRWAGTGTLYDDYGDESGGPKYGGRTWVKLPHDDIDPEYLNGPVKIIQKARKQNGH